MVVEIDPGEKKKETTEFRESEERKNKSEIVINIEFGEPDLFKN